MDLPEPDSPTIAVVVPRLTLKETSSTAVKSVDLPRPRAQLEDLAQVLDLQDVVGMAGSTTPSRRGASRSVGFHAQFLGDLDAPGRQRRRRGHQPLGVRVLRVLQQLQRGAGFDDLAAVHDHHLVGALGGQAEVVGDQQHRRAQFRGHLVQVVQDLALHRHVQGRRRLVGDEQARLAGQADGDQRALAHAAGELVRVLLGPAGGVGQAGLGQDLGDVAPGPPGSPLAFSVSRTW